MKLLCNSLIQTPKSLGGLQKGVIMNRDIKEATIALLTVPKLNMSELGYMINQLSQAYQASKKLDRLRGLMNNEDFGEIPILEIEKEATKNKLEFVEQSTIFTTALSKFYTYL
jgi:hypothetical protein